MSDGERPDAFVLRLYKEVVSQMYPGRMLSWPLLGGHDVKFGGFQGWLVIILIHTRSSGMCTSIGLGELAPEIIGVDKLNENTIERARANIEDFFSLRPRDGVVFVNQKEGMQTSELLSLLSRHEHALGFSPMKIFLSHKGFDKPVVRRYKSVLCGLGFDVWLDEDAMPAGTSLERGILQGFKASCAAVFFVTPSFKDENYIASEVEYARQQKREKGDRFAIITLVLGGGPATSVPDLLRSFVWKEPQTELEALEEIIKALPVAVGRVKWR